MIPARTIRQAARWLVPALLVAGLGAGAAGCFGDECDGGCRDGYACYYGICLSRNYCDEGDPNAEDDPHCASRDEDGACLRWVGLCREGYSCECTFLSGDGSCRERRCLLFSEIEE